MAKTVAQINASITKHEEAILKLRGELAAAPSEYVPEVGANVRFKFGRGEKVRELTGSVLGVQPNEKGSPTVVILSGEGATAEVCRVLAINVFPLGEEVAEETAGDEEVAEEAAGDEAAE